MTEEKSLTKKYLIKLLIKVGNKMKLTKKDNEVMKLIFRKLCSRCNELKKIEEFSPLKTGRFKVHGPCKKCLNEASTEYYRDNYTATGKKK